MTDVCDTCDGEGEYSVQEPDGDAAGTVYRCERCDGEGYIAVDASNANEIHVDTENCDDCNGTGALPVRQPHPQRDDEQGQGSERVGIVDRPDHGDRRSSD